ncbi:MAG: proton-conducting transporter transmembrane domain-containing protein [Candidatus Anammoxibacter sp.]
MKLLQHLPVFVILAPLISSVIIPLVGRKSKLACWIIATTVTFFSFVGSLHLLNTVVKSGTISYWLGGWEPPWGIEYAIDYLNGFVLVVVSFISFVVAFYSRKSVESEIDKDKITSFYAVYMLFITGLLGIVITGDLFNLYVFLEISSLAGYTLIASSRNRGALMASYNYLILGTIAGTFILIGIGHIYMQTGTLNIADLRERLPEFYHSTVVLTAFAFFTVGLCLKVALFPLHVWLPKVYGYAPSVVSTIMAAVGTKVGLYAMLRVMFGVFKVEFDLEVVPVTKILLIVSSIAILAGSILAIAQTRLKWMLAYSSIGQVGYIVLGATLLNQTAMTGSIIHILNHALMKGTLFLVVGCIVYKLGIEDISELKGLGKKMPFTMAAFTIAGLSMIGVPLTVGFVTKWHIAIGALDAGMWYFVPVLIVSSLLTAVYFWRIIEMIYFHKRSTGPGDMQEDRRLQTDVKWHGEEKRVTDAKWQMTEGRRLNPEGRREIIENRRVRTEERRQIVEGSWHIVERMRADGRWEVIEEDDRRKEQKSRREKRGIRRWRKEGGRRLADYNRQLEKKDEAPWSMLAPTLVLAFGCIFFGVASKIPVSIAEKAAALLLAK